MQTLAVRISDLRKVMGVGSTKAYSLIKAGKLTAIKTGNCTLVTVESIQAFLRTAEDTPTACQEPAVQPHGNQASG